MPHRVLLISNRVMHYRVPVYNYFYHRFLEHGVDFLVRANDIQPQNPHKIEFDFQTIPFDSRRYLREIEEISPDAVIFFLHLKDLMLWALVHALKRRGIPTIFWTKGINLDDPDNPVRAAMFHYLHSLFDGLILYSGNEIRYVKPRNRHKISVAPNTLNFDSFPRISETPEQIKREFGIQFQKVVLFVGRMGIAGGRKKVDHIVDVFRDIKNRDWGLVIVGSGMTERTKARLNPENTRYLGELHDPEQVQVNRLFRAADVFCMPGHVGLGLNQAFYWGLPVVTEEGRQPPEFHYLVHGRNGYVVPEDDTRTLAVRVRDLLSNDELRQEMSRHAREDILTHAGVETMFRAFLGAFRRVTGGQAVDTRRRGAKAHISGAKGSYAGTSHNNGETRRV